MQSSPSPYLSIPLIALFIITTLFMVMMSTNAQSAEAENGLGEYGEEEDVGEAIESEPFQPPTQQPLENYNQPAQQPINDLKGTIDQPPSIQNEQPTPYVSPPPDNYEKLTSIDTDMPYRGKSSLSAFFLSLIIGFGAGNYYADNIEAGYKALLFQLIGIGALGGGLAWLFNSPGEEPGTYLDYNLADKEVLPQEIAVYAGAAIFGIARAYDVWSATNTVYQDNKRMRHKFIGFNSETPLQRYAQPIVFYYNQTHYVGMHLMF